MASVGKLTTPLQHSENYDDDQKAYPYETAKGQPAVSYREHPGEDKLQAIIRQWYPGLDTDVYYPSYFCAGLYGTDSFVQEMCRYKGVYTYGKDPGKDPKKKNRKQRPQKTALPATAKGFLQYSDIKNDEAQQRMLWTFATFCQRKNKNKDQAAFILSNMSFNDYMRHYISVAGGKNVSKNEHQAEIDILVFDKANGITILEIKSTGDEETVREISEEQKVEEVKGLFRDPKTEKNKLKEQLQRLMELNQAKDQSIQQSTKQSTKLKTEVDIRIAVLLPNTHSRILDKAREGLDRSVIMEEVGYLCSDVLPTKDEHWRGDLTQDKHDNLLRFWQTLKPVSKKTVYLTSGEPQWYPHTVAQYAGPLTSVSIYSNKTTPRLGVKDCDVRFEGSTVQAQAERFSWIVLHETQTKILEMERDEMKRAVAQFVHLEGPPGTGKTVTLLIRVLTWLDKGHVVWLVSLSPQSRSVTHSLYEQAQVMLNCLRFDKLTADQKSEYQDRLRIFPMNRPPDTCDDDYFEKRLLMFRDKAAKLTEKYEDNYTVDPGKEKMGKVCVVMDETLIDSDAEKFHIHQRFFESVLKLHKQDLASMKQGKDPEIFQRGLSVWSAALHTGGRPAYVTEWGKQTEEQFGLLYELKFPMRCPPAIQRALMLVQDSLTDVCCFQKENTTTHPVDAREPMGPHNHYVSDGVPVKLIAHGSHSSTVASVWECSQCGTELAEYLNTGLQLAKRSKLPPEMQDISVPSDKFLPLRSVLIVPTQRAQQYQMLNSGFSQVMAERSLEIALSAAREEGDAPMPDFNKDVIMVSDITSIHGLERAVVIIIPDVSPDDSVKESTVDQRPHSEEERCRAAFGTLNVECRKDLFYIGSRTVCKLIVFHRGKELGDTERASPGNAARTESLGHKEEPLETSETS